MKKALPVSGKGLWVNDLRIRCSGCHPRMDAVPRTRGEGRSRPRRAHRIRKIHFGSFHFVSDGHDTSFRRVGRRATTASKRTGPRRGLSTGRDPNEQALPSVGRPAKPRIRERLPRVRRDLPRGRRRARHARRSICWAMKLHHGSPCSHFEGSMRRMHAPRKWISCHADEITAIPLHYGAASSLSVVVPR